MFYRWAICAALFGSTVQAAPTHPAAPSPSPTELAQLDGFVLGMTEAQAFSGVVLVARGDRILLERAYGPIDPAADDGPMATIDTRYDLASAGKMFAATAILQLIAAGKLTLATKVGAVLKQYPNRAVAEQVTVEHLLTHRDGSGGSDIFGAENAANRVKARTLAELVALNAAQPLAFAPGSQQEYDNFGFLLLGRIVEALSGEDFATYVSRHIFAPAGMTHTDFVACAERGPEVAVGYATVAEKRVRNCATQPARGNPAGGQITTARDMYRFMRALQTGRLVPPALFAEATRTHFKAFGLGFFATDYGPAVPLRDFRWGHGGGGEDGVNTDLRAYPRTGEIVIVLANHDAPAAHAVARFLHRQYALKFRPPLGR